MESKPRDLKPRQPQCVQRASIRIINLKFGLNGCAESSPQCISGERRTTSNEYGKMPYRETGGGRMKRRNWGFRATRIGSAWGVETPRRTITIATVAVAVGATVCITMHNWQ